MDLKIQLRDFILNEFGEEREIKTLNPEDDLIKQGLVDSVGVLQIINFIEQTLKKRIPDTEISVDNFRSINTMAELITHKAVVVA